MKKSCCHIRLAFSALFLFFSLVKSYSQFSASSTFAGTVTTTSIAQGTDWTNPSYTQTLDNNFATCLITGSNKPTYYLDAKNWGFQSSNSTLPNYIPPSAIINGIEVFITMRGTNVGKIKDNKIILLKAGSETGNSKARGNTLWPASPTEIKFGSNVDLWGATWTATDITNAGFGIRISGKNRGSKDAQAEIDYIHIYIYFNQSFFYSNSSGNLELTTTWGTNTDGTGINPLNFTGDGQVFFLQNRTSASLTANFTISGTDSKMIIGNGSTATTLTVPSNYILNSKVDIAALSNLTINNTTNPTIGSIADNTTVTYGASANQNVQDATYYNLTLSGSGTKTLQNNTSGFSIVNNVLTIGSGITFTNSGDNVFIYGNATGLSNGGIATGNGKYSYSLVDITTNIAGAGTYSNLEIDCGTTGPTKTLTLSNATTVTGILYLTDGTFANGANLSLSSGSAIQLADGTLGSSVSSSGYDVIYDVYSTASPKTASNELTGTVRNCTIQTGSGFAISLNRNLVLTGNLILTSGTLDPTSTNYNITIAGNFTNNGTITSRNNITTFNGSSAQTISAPAAQTFYDLAINNSSGGVQFSTPANINHSLTLTNGIVTTGSTNLLTLANAVTISGGNSSSYINGPLKHTLSATSATKVFPIGKSGTYRPVTLTLTQISSSTTYYTGEVFAGPPPSRTLPTGINSVSSVRYYTISCSDNSNVSSAVVTINYGSDDNVTDPVNLRILKSISSNTDWLNEGGAGSGIPSGNITSNSFNSFSDFVLGYGNFSTLPLQWISFTATLKNGKTELKWQTANEINADHFNIERTNTTSDWKLLGAVSCNNQMQNQYSFIDVSPSSSQNFYRIKSVERDGKISYSGTIALKADISEKITVGPNPVTSSSLNIFIGNSELMTKPEITVRIFDMYGRETISIKTVPQNNLNIPCNSLSNGRYTLTIVADGLEVRKKILVKK